MSEQESWLPVAGYPNYEVSDQGIVRSLSVLRHGVVRPRIKMLKGTPNDAGYLVVNLYRDRKVRTYQIHRLVLETFVGPCPDGMEGCHRDRNPANNRLSNIRWDTGQSNYRDFVDSGGVHWQRQKTECPRGHLLLPENLVERDLQDGRRRCQACESAHWIRKHHPWPRFIGQADSNYRLLTGREPNLTAPGRSPKVAI